MNGGILILPTLFLSLELFRANIQCSLVQNQNEREWISKEQYKGNKSLHITVIQDRISFKERIK
jgi:hypothetical protein